MTKHELLEKDKVNNAVENIGFESLVLADLMARNIVSEEAYNESLKRVKQGEYSAEKQRENMAKELFDLFEPCYKHSKILKRLIIKFQDTPCNKDIVARDIVKHTKFLVTYTKRFNSFFPHFPSSYKYWEKDEALMNFLSFIDTSYAERYSFTYEDFFNSIKYRREICFDDILHDAIDVIGEHYGYSEYNLEGQGLDLIYELQNVTRYGSSTYWNELYGNEDIRKNKDVYKLAFEHAKRLETDSYSAYLYRFVYERCGYDSFAMKKIAGCFAERINDFSRKVLNKWKEKTGTLSQIRLLTINKRSENIGDYLKLLSEDFMKDTIDNNSIFDITAANIIALNKADNVFIGDQYEELGAISTNPLIVIWQTSKKDYYFLDQETKYRCHAVVGDITNELPRRNEALISVPNNTPLSKIALKARKEFNKPYIVNKRITTTKGFSVIALNNSVDAKFIDGYIGHATPKQFEDGKIEHPLITSKGKTITYQKTGIKERLIGTRCGLHNDKTYYKCNCEKCNWKHKKILSARQFLQHGKECFG